MARFKAMPDNALTTAQNCLSRLLRIQNTVDDDDHQASTCLICDEPEHLANSVPQSNLRSF